MTCQLIRRMQFFRQPRHFHARLSKQSNIHVHANRVYHQSSRIDYPQRCPIQSNIRNICPPDQFLPSATFLHRVLCAYLERLCQCTKRLGSSWLSTLLRFYHVTHFEAFLTIFHTLRTCLARSQTSSSPIGHSLTSVFDECPI